MLVGLVLHICDGDTIEGFREGGVVIGMKIRVHIVHNDNNNDNDDNYDANGGEDDGDDGDDEDGD